MAQSTLITGPYDGVSTADKIRLMVGVPLDIVKELFPDLFPRRGVQDKILARLFHLFYLELTSDYFKTRMSETVTTNDREEVLNELLNKLAQLQSQFENQHVPESNSTPSSPTSAES
jgi:hypothetical protein